MLRANWFFENLRDRLARHFAPHGLDAILSHAPASGSFEERLRWMASLTRWIGRRTPLPADASKERTLPGPQTRLRYVLNLLDRNPEWKGRVGRTLRSVLEETDSLELLCEAGIPREPSFLSEIVGRLLARALPTNPFAADLGTVLLALFPDAEDVDWLDELDGDLLARLVALLREGVGPDGSAFAMLRLDGREAALILVGDIRSTGLSTPIRRRLGSVAFRNLPFFRLTRLTEELIGFQGNNSAAFESSKAELADVLDQCDATAETVFRHLDELGVSVRVVYLVERMQAQIRRARLLLGLAHAAGARPAAALHLLAHLVRACHDQRSLRSLATRNLHLLARNLVERSAETGEHYIARDRREFASMLRSASGGGVVAALVTWVKIGITSLHGPYLAEGLLASLNYALGFVAIQFAHFTLATKQPATTAPALAARLREANDEAGLERFTDSVVDLVRSQMASIIGNLALTIPVSLAIGLLARWAFGHPIVPVAKALSLLSSVSLFGPSVLYAALTGLFLWWSAVLAAAADNWYALRRVGEGIRHDPLIVALVGRRFASRVAQWLDDNIAGLSGNVSLGFMLGFIPAVFAALGLPIEIRHVTIAAGQLAASASTLGLPLVSTWAFWLSVAGVLAIGVINVGVSFSLALGVAVRARAAASIERRAIRKAIAKRLFTRPLDFFWPPSDRPQTPGAE